MAPAKNLFGQLPVTCAIESPERRGFIKSIAASATVGLMPEIALGEPNMESTKTVMPLDLPAAWEKYYSSIDEARAMLKNTARFKEHPEYRARAYSTLLEAQAMAYNYAIAPRLNQPYIYSQSIYHSNVFALGQNGPDFRYGGLFLDGRETYRLTGRLGQLKACLIQVHSHLMGHPESKEIGNYDFHKFALKDNGTFDVTVSAQKHQGNWIRLDPSSNYNYLFLRRIFGDYFDDTGDLQIEMISRKGRYEKQDDEVTPERISLAADFLKWLIKAFAIGIYDMYLKGAGGKNKVCFIAGQDLADNYAGSPSTTYGMILYDISPDEALVIEYQPPASAYWSFQLGDIWCNSPDFFFYQTDVNMTHAVIDADGKCRVVVSLADPGVPNWLDTTGTLEGLVTMRNYRATSASVAPTVSKVKLAALRESLPRDTPIFTPEQRETALAYRHRGYRHLFGD